MRPPRASRDAAARALRFGALLLVVFGVGEALVVGEPVWGSIVTRLVWAAVALTVAAAIDHEPPVWRAEALAVLGGSAPLFYAAVVEYRGGTAGVPFAFFTAMPLVIAVILQGEVLAVACSAVLTPAVGSALLARGGVEARGIAEWGLAASASSVIAIYGAVLTRRVRHGEQRSHAAQVEAERQLSLRERALAEAERLAVVGQLAAGLSHEVNNPLASVIANVGFLEQELAAAGIKGGEATEMLRDVRVGAERIAAVMREIAASAPAQDGSAQACALAPIVEEAAAAGRPPQGLVVERQVPEALPLVHASPPQLKRALTQLFIFLGGEARGGPNRVLVTGREEPSGVLLELRVETGMDPGAATGPVRAGLGLTLIGESMRLWGGELVASPERGPIRTVTLRFRSAADRPAQPSSDAVSLAAGVR